MENASIRTTTVRVGYTKKRRAVCVGYDLVAELFGAGENLVTKQAQARLVERLIGLGLLPVEAARWDVKVDGDGCWLLDPLIEEDPDAGPGFPANFPF